MLNSKMIMVCAFVLSWGLSSVSMAANIPESGPPINDDHWRFTIAPYGFIFGMSGYAVVRGNKLKIKTTSMGACIRP